MVALNFPSTPSEGQKFSSFVFTGGLWKSSTAPRTALPFNYIVNPAMQISAQNSNTAGTTDGYYGADQWVTKFFGGAVITTQRMQVVTPNGSKDRYRITVTTADTSLGVGDYTYVSNVIEGFRAADLQWGTANAKQIIVRFGFKGPAGTYSAGVRNGAESRAYPSNFNISAGQANTDTEQIIIIPGDTTGTWAKDNTAGIMFFVTVAAGIGFMGTNNTWVDGSIFRAPGITNGTATAGAVYEIFDVGFYADPYLTGKPPPWQAISEHQARLDSMRYFYIPRYAQGLVTGSTSCGRVGHVHPVTMRIAPTYALPTGTVSAGNASGTVSAGAVNAYSNVYGWEFNGTTSAGFTTGQANSALVSAPLSARM